MIHEKHLRRHGLTGHGRKSLFFISFVQQFSSFSCYPSRTSAFPRILVGTDCVWQLKVLSSAMQSKVPWGRGYSIDILSRQLNFALLKMEGFFAHNRTSRPSRDFLETKLELECLQHFELWRENLQSIKGKKFFIRNLMKGNYFTSSQWHRLPTAFPHFDNLENVSYR